jgi:anti-sigma factor RsiW
LEAPANIRLACQLHPTSSMTVTILNRPAVPGPVQVEFVEIKAFIAAHTRAVLSGEAVDHASDDARALTRWFADKISYAVSVPALGDRRFSLCGGRVDYLDARPVAAVTFVYAARWISLFMVPPGDAEAVRGTRNGYSVVGWEDASLAYFAVSDLGSEMLEMLQDAVRATVPLAAQRRSGNDDVSTLDPARLRV